MVTITDTQTTIQIASHLQHLLRVQASGGANDPVTETFVAFTPAQLAALQTRIDTILANLQTFAAAIVP